MSCHTIGSRAAVARVVERTVVKLVVVMLSVVVMMPSIANGQQVPKDQCSLLTAADVEALLGKGASPTPIGNEECRYEGPQGGYEVHVKRQNGAAELKDWTDMTMVKPVAPLKDIGDEAFVSKNQNVVAFRKGNVAVRVSASGVMKTAPMTYQLGVVEAAKRISAKLK